MPRVELQEITNDVGNGITVTYRDWKLGDTTGMTPEEQGEFIISRIVRMEDTDTGAVIEMDDLSNQEWDSVIHTMLTGLRPFGYGTFHRQ